jgi:hypothetical protein
MMDLAMAIKNSKDTIIGIGILLMLLAGTWFSLFNYIPALSGAELSTIYHLCIAYYF